MHLNNAGAATIDAQADAGRHPILLQANRQSEALSRVGLRHLGSARALGQLMRYRDSCRSFFHLLFGLYCCLCGRVWFNSSSSLIPSKWISRRHRHSRFLTNRIWRTMRTTKSTSLAMCRSWTGLSASGVSAASAS